MIITEQSMKSLLLWAPVPPVMAVTLFQGRHAAEPQVLQYAHRVLEQHPVNLTFFFVPQIVQALRVDKLGESTRPEYEHSLSEDFPVQAMSSASSSRRPRSHSYFAIKSFGT